MAEGKTNMFGKTYNTIGSTDSNFIIKTKGDLKIQWGNKYIDVIKNGKIVSNDISIFYIVETKDDIKNDGIYLVGKDLLWVSIKGQLFNIPMDETESSGTSYISFLVDQLLKPEEKYRALTNIGFYYKSLNDVKDITSGLVYIEETLKLYIIDKGVLTPYYTVEKTDLSEISNTLDELWVGSLHLYQQEGYGIIDSSVNMMISLESIPYLILEDETVKVQASLQMSSDSVLMSENANDYYGYKLYVENEVSTLEVDNIIWRKHPTLITYKELKKRIDEKTLAPKLYYLITDFLNPWEVTWDNEPLYYEDEYKEINGEQRLSNIRNALQLIVRAANEELLEELAWSPLHPDWIIHYDPYFLGEEHILAEDNILYGYRSRKNASNETEYLPCKGQITYLKDEYGNEGNFNFRHLQFKRKINYSSFVWRYCMDLSEDNVKLLGTFFPGTNNKFNFKNLEIFVLVFLCNPIENNGVVVDYEIINKDYNIQISLGYSIYINSKLVENNIFENLVTNRLTHEVIETNIINNQFYEIKRIAISKELELKNNIVKNINFECAITGEFNDNYLDTITILYSSLVSKGWKFNKNTIVNTTLYNFIESNYGEFIENNIKDSKITMLSSILNGNIIGNIFENITVVISNNSGTIQGNKFMNSERLNITNTGFLETSSFNETTTIQNSGNVSYNTFNKIKTFNNSGEISKNVIDEITQLQNTSIFNNNNIKTSEKISNSGTMNDNIINESTTITNSGTFLANNLLKLLQLINNNGTFSENDILELQTVTNYKNFTKNIINKINVTSLSINYDLLNNVINEIISISIYANITNNKFEDINNCTFRGLTNNNTFKTLNTVRFQNSVENNIFSENLQNCTFNNVVSDNIACGELIDITISGVLKNNIFKLAVLNFSVRGMENCTLEKINNLHFTHAIYNTTFHGVIGSVTRQLTKYEQGLLSSDKKTELYPNIEVIIVPDILLTGMVIMWHGSVIPRGWWPCDGTHGTPDLRGLFIRAAKNTSDVGFSKNDHLEENVNEIKLKQSQLPEHSHPHKEHTHKIDGLTASSGYEGVSVTSSLAFAYTDGTTEVSTGVEGADSKKVVNGIEYKSVQSSGGSHNHSITISGSIESVESKEKDWQYGDLKTILIEPRHYKIIFIMKIDESEWSDTRS